MGLENGSPGTSRIWRRLTSRVPTFLFIRRPSALVDTTITWLIGIPQGRAERPLSASAAGLPGSARASDLPSPLRLHLNSDRSRDVSSPSHHRQARTPADGGCRVAVAATPEVHRAKKLLNCKIDLSG